jgi:hypothetical protein
MVHQMRIPPDAIPLIASVFDALHGRSLDDWEIEAIGHYRIDQNDPQLLKNLLIELISADDGVDDNTRSSAYWALGKSFDMDLRTFFCQQLRIEVERDIDATYQIMIALDNLSEPVFGAYRRGSYSSLDHDKNRTDAVAYLSTLG